LVLSWYYISNKSIQLFSVNVLTQEPKGQLQGEKRNIKKIHEKINRKGTLKYNGKGRK
jgi:hypothetical protein